MSCVVFRNFRASRKPHNTLAPNSVDMNIKLFLLSLPPVLLCLPSETGYPSRVFHRGVSRPASLRGVGPIGRRQAGREIFFFFCLSPKACLFTVSAAPIMLCLSIHELCHNSLFIYKNPRDLRMNAFKEEEFLTLIASR